LLKLFENFLLNSSLIS